MAKQTQNDFSLAHSGLAQDALLSWQQMASEVFVPLRLTQMSARFHWAVSGYDFGDVALSDIRLAEHHVERAAADIDSKRSNYFLLSLQIDGLAKFRHTEGESWVGPGDCILYDASTPYAWHFETPMRQHVIRLPRALLHSRVPNVHRLTGRRLTSLDGMTSVFANSFSSAVRTASSLQHEDRSQLTNALMILLGQALGSQLGGKPEDKRDDGASAAKFARIEAYLDAHLTEDTLSVGRLCHVFAITPKTLHRLFKASTDESPMRMLQRKRLECAAADLKDPLKSGVSITQIAMRYGFCDTAHFSNRFKKHFGVSPSDTREANLP
jgi:AraC-like DNA-binding protein